MCIFKTFLTKTGDIDHKVITDCGHGSCRFSKNWDKKKYAQFHADSLARIAKDDAKRKKKK